MGRRKSAFRPAVLARRALFFVAGALMTGFLAIFLNYTETLELNTALDEEPEKVWTPEGLLALAFANPPYFAPGEGYHYSNTNTVLLGLIAEELDGKPIAQIFQDRFFTPLGMTGSSFPADTDTSIPTPYADGGV